METNKSDIQAALDAGKELAIRLEYTNDGTPYAFVPSDNKLEKFPELRAHPSRIIAKTKHSTAESFLAYYKEFSLDSSVIFLDTNNNQFTAIIDYHIEHGQADWCDHYAIFSLKKTPEWSAWEANNKKLFTQEEFGRFIEDNLIEIVDPPNGVMLEVALSLQAKTKVDFSRSIRLENGQTQLHYLETIEGNAGLNGSLKIPELFSIGLQLFEGGTPYQIEARFRYRIKEGKLTLWYELVRPHKTIEANVLDTKTRIINEMAKGRFFEAVID